ncbi:MAG: hypothetical protein DRN30_04780 [Thermoplasmata archaeon]|nr:hypothetical protein [Euryarchaeota archaeon]RLF64985.1 MAG: hypothetical protein DRN30_04780 [Thermoplasmata archaeon]
MRRTIKLGTRAYEIEVPRKVSIEQFEADIYTAREGAKDIEYVKMFTSYRPGMKVGLIVDLSLKDPFMYTVVDNALSTLHSLGAYDEEIVLFFTSRIDPREIPPIYSYRYENIIAKELEGSTREQYVTLSTLEDVVRIEVHKAFERNLSRGSESGLNAVYVISDSFIDGIFGVRTPVASLLDFLSLASLSSIMRFRAEVGLQEFTRILTTKLMLLPPFRYLSGGIALLKDFMNEVFSVSVGDSKKIHEDVIEKYLRAYGYAIPEKYDILILGLTGGTLEVIHRALTLTRNVMKQGTVVILCADNWNIKLEHEERILDYLSERKDKIITGEDVIAYEIAKSVAERSILLVGRGRSKIFEVFSDIQEAIDIALEKTMSTEPKPKILVLSYADYLIPANLLG